MLYSKMVFIRTEMDLIILCVMISVFSTTVLSTCELASRIKHNDSEVMVTQTDEPCTLTLTARNNKQVVVVMYDFLADCIEKATIAIYDGPSTNAALLTNLCQARPWSFASRTHSLTLTPVPGKSLRPFSLDIYAIDTMRSYFGNSGTIQSQRYLGYISGESLTNTTPNNFHGIYRIVAKTDVTMRVKFQEFRIDRWDGTTCSDFVQIESKPMESAKLCGDNILPRPILIITKNLTIEFYTDKEVTFTGFTATYDVCFRDSFDSKGRIDFQAFPESENMACAYTINVQRKSRIAFSLTFDDSGKCSDILTIFSAAYAFKPHECSSESYYSGSIEASQNVLLRFTFKRGQSVTGNYSFESVNGKDNNQQIDSSDSALESPNDITVIIVPIVTVLLIAAIVVAIVISYKRGKLNALHCKDKQREYEAPLPPVSEASYSQPVHVNSATNNKDVYVNEDSTDKPQTYYNVEGSVQYEDVGTESNYEGPIRVPGSNTEHQYADLRR